MASVRTEVRRTAKAIDDHPDGAEAVMRIVSTCAILRPSAGDSGAYGLRRQPSNVVSAAASRGDSSHSSLHPTTS